MPYERRLAYSTYIEVVTRNLSDTNQEIETNGYEIKLNDI